MKKICLLFLLVASFANIYAAWSAEKTAAFLAEMERAANPNNIKNIKSMQISGESTILKLNVKMLSDTIYKAPDKLKQTVSVPNMQTTTVYFNGTKGVEVDSIGGVTPISGNRLTEVKTAVKMLNPAMIIKDIFDKIEIADELAERDGRKYIVVIGSFKPELKIYPYKFLVDPDTKLVVYSSHKTATQLGAVESETHNLEWKMLNGLRVPVKFVQSMMNMQIEGRLTNFSVNGNYPDSLFEYKE